MFDFLKRVNQANKSVWQNAGYFADVVAAYGTMTGQRLDKLILGPGDKHLLDAFLAEASRRGLTANECAATIFCHGYLDLAVLRKTKSERESEPQIASVPDMPKAIRRVDYFGEDPQTTPTRFAPAVPDMLEARQSLDTELTKMEMDFTYLPPTVYHSMIVEVSAFGNPADTIEKLFDIIQGIASMGVPPEKEEAWLVTRYTDRTKALLAKMA